MNIAGRLLMIFLIAGVSCAAGQEVQAPAAQAIFQYQEVMVPVRDGVHLQTVILTPTNATKQLPICSAGRRTACRRKRRSRCLRQ